MQDYRIDPLTHAVENAWRAGIVVVVAGGNSGTDQPAAEQPGVRPLRARRRRLRHQGTVGASDDLVPAFSSRGDAARRVDLVAPGRSIKSRCAPRAPTSTRRTPTPGWRPLLQGQRLLAGRRGGVGRGGPAAAEPARPASRPGEGAAAGLGRSDARGGRSRPRHRRARRLPRRPRTTPTTSQTWPPPPGSARSRRPAGPSTWPTTASSSPAKCTSSAPSTPRSGRPPAPPFTAWTRRASGPAATGPATAGARAPGPGSRGPASPGPALVVRQVVDSDTWTGKSWTGEVLDRRSRGPVTAGPAHLDREVWTGKAWTSAGWDEP